MPKPDFEKIGRDLWTVVRLDMSYVTPIDSQGRVADALRAAYEAGMERAAEILLSCDGWVDPAELNQLAAAIRAEKEAEHE